MRRIPSLRSVLGFEAAARLGSIQLAADELHLTPSAVSHQIKSLEDEIGARLFHRSHRSIILTDIGRKYAEEVGQGLSLIANATRNLGKAEREDILTIHVVPSLAAQWLMPLLSRFSMENADIDVRLHASPTPVDLSTGTVDLAIQYGTSLQQNGTIIEPFPPETISVFCSPNLLQKSSKLQCYRDLQNFPLIHSEVNLYGWRDWMRDHPEVKLNLDRGPRFDRSFMSINSAADGRGVCLESRLLVQREMELGTLIAPFGGEGPKIVCHSLLYLSSKAKLPKLIQFREWLFAALSESRL